MSQTLKPFADRVWTYAGETVSFHGMPYTTRMTVVQLESGEVWVHSPSNLTSELVHTINQIGPVTYLVSPNKIHHLYLKDWVCAFPEAVLYASPGLINKRRDLNFDRELTNSADDAWSTDLHQVVFTGSKMMEEVVFFHKVSQTLILTDLIENFPTDHFRGLQKCLARCAGILAPNGKTPLDWRLTFYLGGKAEAQQCINLMLSWQPERIIVAHGNCIQQHGAEFLKKSFNWLI